MSRLRLAARPLLRRRGITTTTHTIPETVTSFPVHAIDIPPSSSSSPVVAQTEASDPPPSEWDDLIESRRRRQVIQERFGTLGSTQTRDNTFQPHHPLHRPVDRNASSTLSSLVAAGAHMGHSSSLLRPAFLPYAYGTRAGITVIDLDQTLALLRRAANVTEAVARNGGSILFAGTRDSLRPAVVKAAERMGQNAYHLATRWKPGTLTNAQQLFGEDVATRQNPIPDLVVILNPLDNMVLIKECCAKHVPTIGIIDSNVDPRIVTYAIPANDDSVRTAELIVGMLSMAGKKGIQAAEALAEAKSIEQAEQTTA